MSLIVPRYQDSNASGGGGHGYNNFVVGQGTSFLKYAPAPPSEPPKEKDDEVPPPPPPEEDDSDSLPPPPPSTA